MAEAVQEEEVVEKEEGETEVEKEEEGTEETVEGTQEEPSKKEGEEKGGSEVVEGEVTTVSIGDDKAQEEDKTPAPGWVKEVRQRNRELEKQNRELQKQLQTQGQQQAPAVGKKPEMSDPDIDYDADKFEKALSAYMGRKAKADEEAKRVEAAQKTEQTAWQAKLDAYGTAKAAIKVPDLAEAEALVQETLSEKQQAIILKGAKNPALLVYALGKNPAKLQELAKVTDLVEFAATVFRDVEGQLKVTTKKATPPAPEKKVTGTAPNSGAMDNTLEKLRAEAERTGDYTKVTKYKREKKAA